MASSNAAGQLARKALMEDARQEEAITVNQRALIDKILARYAAEFTVFRELLQNADDAGATHCELRFESQRSSPSSTASQQPSSSTSSSNLLPDFKATLSNWVFRNDGKPFGNDDWSRLRRIAEGNPDPDRIGAFGVGFYSLFSICEEPIVSSADELMGFFWKGDSLFTKRATNTDRQNAPSGRPWTTFFMALREPAPFPDSPMALAKFLATSLTFTTQIKSISLYWDDHLLCKLNKKLALPKPMVMPSHLNANSPGRTMRVRDLESTAVQIDVQALRLVIDAFEKEKPKPKLSLTSALGKSSGGGLTSMLQSAFGFGSSSSKEKEKERELQARREAEQAAANDKAKLDTTAALLTSVSASIHLRIATANVAVSADKAFQKEIERSTKKPPPKLTAFHLIFTGKEEYDASFPQDTEDADNSLPASSSAAALDKGARQIFSGLMPRLEDQGHAFIGFRTHQTTGFSGHIAARFIPTVERESLDFVDRYCAQWNSELLSMGGYVARAVYENELADIGRLWTNTFADKRPTTDDDQALAKSLKDRALHLMRFFTMRTSSPSSRVSSLFLTSFFGAARQNTISLMSTRGVKHSAAVRMPNTLLSDFIKDLAVIPPNHMEEAPDFVREVRSRNLVQDITMDDVFSELSSRALSTAEMVACLRWWTSVAAHPSYDVSLRSKLLNSAMLTIADPKDTAVPEKFQPLSIVRFYLNTSRLPTDVPLPDSCLSYDVSKSFTSNELARVFGWSELTVSTWLKNLVQISVQARRSGSSAISETDLQTSPAFAEKVLLTLSRAWFALPSAQHDDIQQILADTTCIPTRSQMQKPGDAYFANVSLFSDLPIIELPSGAQVKGNLEKVLIALGVRRHVELQMIFTRLVADGGWSHVDLLAYLASIKDSLSELEKDRLKTTAIFPKHGEVGPLKEDGTPRIIRHRARDLYEPTEALKALQLPVLDWANKPWRPSSDETRFVFDLGLRRYPPMETILEIAATNQDAAVRSKALAFFLEKFHAHYINQYTIFRAEKYAFVPARLPNENKLVLRKPTEVFTNAEAAVMGFAVAGPEINLADLPKLGLRSNPTATQLIARLVNSPTRDEALARKIFEYLATVNEFSLNDFKQLRGAEFIPVRRTKRAETTSDSATGASPADVMLVAPMNCYFGGSTSDVQFRDVFFYCDFGSVAGAFLKNCGVRNEPSIEEVAERLVNEPQRFYQLAGSADAYLGILRQIATNWDRIRSPLRKQMARSPFLLGSKRIQEGKAEGGAQKAVNLMDADDDEQDEEADDAGTLVYALKKPADVVIVDDANSHMLFASSLFYAPHEDLLQEGLYAKLGSPRLSSLVEERYLVEGRVVTDTQRAREIKALVLERTPLFLFEKRQTSRSEIRKDGEWLKSALEVEEIDGAGLRQVRTLRYDRVHEQNVQKCTATASMRGSKLVLHLSSSMEVDFFEVANSLSKYLLTKQRLQEVLLYMTLLSTSLRNLKRRGFHVDKILSQRKAEREAAEARMREERLKAEERAAEDRATEDKMADWRKQVLSIFPDADPRYVDQALRSHSDAHVERTTNDMLSSNYPRRSKETSSALASAAAADDESYGAGDVAAGGKGGAGAGGGFLSGFRNRFMQAGGKQRSSLAEGTSSITRPGQGGSGALSGGGQMGEDRALGGLATGGGGGAATAPTRGVTPLSSINNNVLQAIRASRPDASSSIKSEARHGQIKEAADTYCDATPETDLKLAGEVAGMKVFLHSSLDAASMLQANASALERLINRVFSPVGSIFGLDPRSMNVFCDTEGPVIAFNRGGAIYLNFRYYLAWHDELVRQGKMADALVSTYFSVAHEIAHNVVAAHNAEHEYYFSAIAEKYVVSLVEYIAKAEAEARMSQQ